MDPLNQVERLTMDANLLSLLISHLLANEAKNTADPEIWLRQFANNVHRSLKYDPDAPSDIQDELKLTRRRLDDIFASVRRMLSK